MPRGETPRKDQMKNGQQKHDKKQAPKPFTDRDHINAIFDALPWLKDNYDPTDYDKAKILPFNREVMDHLCEFETVGSAWWIKTSRPKEQICLYTEDGEFLGQVGFVQNGWSAIFGGLAISFNVFDETVREGMIRIEGTAIHKERCGGALKHVKFPKVRWAVGVYKDDDRLTMLIGKVPENWKELYRAETEKAVAEARTAAEAALNPPKASPSGGMLPE
jgi:hypothetical protein